MDTIIKKLGIQVEETENGYVYKFDDYDEFTEIYNKLESMTAELSKNSPQSYLNESECHVEFDAYDYFVYLEGDLNIDDYVLRITK